MLPRLASAHQRPADPHVLDIGVGIDTFRYGHYLACSIISAWRRG